MTKNAEKESMRYQYKLEKL